MEKAQVAGENDLFSVLADNAGGGQAYGFQGRLIDTLLLQALSGALGYSVKDRLMAKLAMGGDSGPLRNHPKFV
jgi:hypothetical protein